MDSGCVGGDCSVTVVPAVADPDNPDPPTAIFYARFTLPGYVTSGGIWVWADDTAEIWLNSTKLFPYQTQRSGGDRDFCVGSAPGCKDEAGAFVDLAGYGAGEYTLEIRAFQLWGGPFGTLYEGQIDWVPEPSQWALFALGLTALGLRLARRQRN